MSSTAPPAAATGGKKWTKKEVEATFPREFHKCTPVDLKQRTRLLQNEIRIFNNNKNRINNENAGNKEKLKENLDKIKLNKKLPYLVGNVVEVW